MNLRRLLPLALIAALTLGACGGEKDAGDPTPEEVRSNLIDADYVVGDVLTEGAPEGVVDGKDADAYLSVDGHPDGGVIYVGVYFLPDEAMAQDLYDRYASGSGTAAEVRGTRVYNIAGDQETLDEVIEAAEG